MSGIGYITRRRADASALTAMSESESKPPSIAPPQSPDGRFDVDAELVRLAQAGRHSAFELLVVKYQRRVAATISGMVRNDAITEELVQETFLSAFRALPELRAEVAFFAWLQVIARNLASTHLRQAARGAEQFLMQSERQAEVSEAGEHIDPQSEVPGSIGRVFANTPEDELVAKQLFASLETALQSLPAAQRDALLMREIDGLDYQSIAATMALPLNSVKSLIYRARESVATQLGPQLEPNRNRRW